MTGRDFLAGRALGLNAAETATLVEAIADGHAVEDDYDLARRPAEWQWGVMDDDGDVIPTDDEVDAWARARLGMACTVRRRVGEWEEP